MKEILYLCQELDSDSSVVIHQFSQYKDCATLSEILYPGTITLYHIFSRCVRRTLLIVQVNVYDPSIYKPALFLRITVNSRIEHCSILYTKFA
jgi:hypothetical protein